MTNNTCAIFVYMFNSWYTSSTPTDTGTRLYNSQVVLQIIISLFLLEQSGYLFIYYCNISQVFKLYIYTQVPINYIQLYMSVFCEEFVYILNSNCFCTKTARQLYCGYLYLPIISVIQLNAFYITMYKLNFFLMDFFLYL